MSAWSGSKVRAARAFWLPRLPLPCRRCGRIVTSSMKWQVGHIIDRALGGPDTIDNTYPEHARCNLSAGGKLGAAKTNARRGPVVERRTSERARGIRGW